MPSGQFAVPSQAQSLLERAEADNWMQCPGCIGTPHQYWYGQDNHIVPPREIREVEIRGCIKRNHSER